MTTDQREFIELTRRAVRDASPVAYPALCAIREESSNEAAEMVLRFALTNALTPQEALPHIEAYLTES